MVDKKSVADMSEKLAPDNAALFEEDAAVVADDDAAVVVAVDCKWIASMGVNCKGEVLSYTVAFDYRYSTDAPISHFVRVNDYLQWVLWV